LERESVRSSNLASVGYDANSKTLEIEFKNRRVYQYFQVPAMEYLSLINAESVGRYFSAEIRGAYDETEIL
jgi:hypothetical protein